MFRDDVDEIRHHLERLTPKTPNSHAGCEDGACEEGLIMCSQVVCVYVCVCVLYDREPNDFWRTLVESVSSSWPGTVPSITLT